jgi:hypothetical protein
MKKFILLLLPACISFNIANSQITKNNWLVGGTGRLSFQKETLNSSDVKGFKIDLSPNVGYFFVDKFAGGIRARLAYDKVKFRGGVSKTTQLGIGPFLRYYFLESGKRVNLFAETAYQYLNNSGNGGITSNSANTFTFSAGPVLYFNTSVGIEFTVNYELYNTKDANTSAKTFFLGIGFQIHLEKDNNQ